MSQTKAASSKNADSQEQFYVLLSALGGSILLLSLLGVWLMWGSNPDPSPESSARAGMVMSREEKPSDTAVLPQPLTQSTTRRGGRPSGSGGPGPSKSGSGKGPSDGSNPSEKVLRTYSGSGHKTLPPFEVSGSWKVQWEANKFFAAYLRDANSGKLIDTLGDSQKQGNASSSGKYYLEVAASGNWSVKVVQAN